MLPGILPEAGTVQRCTMTAQIFISHSSRSEVAKSYLDAFTEAFAGQDQMAMLPWLDRKDLKPGDAWRDKIFEAIADARGAILLLSKAAAESEYVEIEAAVLRYRSRTEGNFPYLIVQVDADTRELTGVLAHLSVRENQLVRAATPAEAARATLARLKELLELDLIAPRSYFEELRGFVVKDLQRAGLAAAHVAAFARKHPELCGVRPYRPSNEADSCRWMANLLLSADPQSATTIFSYLYDCTPESAAVEILRGVLDRLAPLWVDDDIASAIAAKIQDKTGARQMAVGYNTPQTLDVLVCRARSRQLGKPKMPLHLPPSLREEDAADDNARAEWVKAKVLQHAGGNRPPGGDRLERAFQDHAFEKMTKDEGMIVVSFPECDWWPPSGEFLAALQAKLAPVVACFQLLDAPVDPPVAYVGGLAPDQEVSLVSNYDEILQNLKVKRSESQ